VCSHNALPKHLCSGSSSSDASTSANSSKPIASIAIKRKAEDKEGETKKAKKDSPAKANGDSTAA
jgi:hypothetical protein